MQYYQNLPLKDIVAGSNPRTYFAQNDLDDLCQSIKSLGVIQPILVTETVDENGDKKFKITAGERRFRASVMAYGLDEGTIPALVRKDDTDTTTRQLAITENYQRQAMSPTEESDAAAKILADFNGDKEETMRRLGLKPAVLNARLALQNLIPSVKQALNERRILLGHAELLAVIATPNQKSALATILEHKLTVGQTKEALVRVSQNLKKAIFDKTQCQNCVSNSEIQATLLETSVGDGYCTNRECYSEKTATHVEQLATELRDELPKVEVIREFNGIAIVSVSQNSVGETQFDSCKGCANFGATISLLPDSTGVVTRNQCFDSKCNSEMVTQNALALAKQRESSTIKSTLEIESNDKAPSKPKEPKGGNESVPRKTVNQRAIEFKQNTWRKIVANELCADPHKVTSVFLTLMYTGSMSSYQLAKVVDLAPKIFGHPIEKHSKIHAVLETFSAMSDEKRDQGTRAAVASLMLTIAVDEVFKIAEFYKFDLMKHWRINKEYCELFTKSELESMCIETGLNTFFESETEFKKALTQKKTDLINSILALDANWSELIPAAMALAHTPSVKQHGFHPAKEGDATSTPITPDQPCEQMSSEESSQL